VSSICGTGKADAKRGGQIDIESQRIAGYGAPFTSTHPDIVIRDLKQVGLVGIEVYYAPVISLRK